MVQYTCVEKLCLHQTMAKNKLLIPVTMIKPVHKKASSQELLLRPMTQIMKTKGLKMVRPCTPKSSYGKAIRRPKGVLGVIISPILSSDEKVTISLLDAASATQIVAGNTKLEGDLVIITPSNKVSPAHLPELSDLALLPRYAKYFLRWLISSQGGKEGSGFEHVLQREVVEVVDPPLEIPPTIKCCHLSLGDHLIKIPSYRNYFKIFNLQHPMYVSNIHLRNTTNTSNILDGRTMEVKIQVSVNEEGGFWSKLGTMGLRYVVWNCRDMGRHTFLPLLRSLMEMHMPHFMILTETRVSIPMARLICAYLHLFAVHGNSRNDYEGGYVMLAFSKHMNMKLISSFPNEYSWA